MATAMAAKRQEHKETKKGKKIKREFKTIIL